MRRDVGRTAGVFGAGVLALDGVYEVLHPPARQYRAVRHLDLCGRRGGRTQCQKTMSPGATRGTLVMAVSRRRWGCDCGSGRGPAKPPALEAKMPGKSGEEIGYAGAGRASSRCRESRNVAIVHAYGRPGPLNPTS